MTNSEVGSLVAVIEFQQREFSESTFPNATYETCLEHLKSEIGEIKTADNDVSALHEYADAFLLLIDSYRRRLPKLDIQCLLVAAHHKIQVNKNRKWGAANKEGFYEHIKE